MSLALAILMIFLGSTLLWVASHGTTATTPWGIFKEVTDKVGATDGD